MTTPANPADQQGSRPVPDPTILTTEALTREIANLEKLITARLERAEDLRNEKFQSVHQRLDTAEEQRREQKTDTNAAIGAALDAQEKAASKSEAAISKQLEQLQTTFNTEIDNLAKSLSGVADRVTRMEAVKLGGTEGRTGLYATVAVVGTVILSVLAIIAFAVR